MEKPLPYSKWCYVCGKDNPLGFKVIFSAERGRVRVRHIPEVHRQGYLGVVHGGVISTLLDEAMGWAPTLAIKRMFVTAELTVRYLKPFPIGKAMLIEAWPERVSRRMALVSGQVKDEAGELYASATGKYLPMSQEETKRVDELLIYEPQTLRVFQEDT